MNGVTFDKSASIRDMGDHERTLVRVFDLLWITVAATLIPVSLIWDFSWESTVGVDRFWSPPHVATHIGVWLCGLLGLRLVFVFALARHQGDPMVGVAVGPLCGPSGAWILLWGAMTIQGAVLLDTWWQQAYGLGAGLWHPPQMAKTLGFFTLLFGGVVSCAGARSSRNPSERTPTVFLTWLGGLLLTMGALVLTVKNYPNWQHTSGFYTISCAIYPAILVAMATGSSSRWGATLTALVYMAIACAMVWLLPLFPARPLTAPIHNPMNHMMPPSFPLLLVVPAMAMDLARRRFRFEKSDTVLSAGTPGLRRELSSAIVAGLAFVATFVPTQWFFAKFLLSTGADNWFFAGGGKHWPFFLKIDQARVMFWGVNQDPLNAKTAFLATVFAIASSWIGVRVGRWLSALRR